MKISSDKTQEQDSISKLQNKVHVITGTLNINFLASKFDESILVLSGIFDILIVKEIKLDNTFHTSQFYIESFSMPYRLDRNRNGGGLPMSKNTFPLKSLQDIICPKILKESFVEINFQKSK